MSALICRYCQGDTGINGESPCPANPDGSGWHVMGRTVRRDAFGTEYDVPEGCQCDTDQMNGDASPCEECEDKGTRPMPV